MQKILSIIVIVILLGCNNSDANLEQNDFKVSGTIHNAHPNTYISLIHRTADNTYVLDSVIIENSSFELKANITNKIDFYLLKLSNNDYYIHLLADSGDNIFLEADFLNLQNYKIKNSAESILLQELENHLFNTNDSIKKLINNNIEYSEVEKIIEKQKQFSLDFISKHDTSLAVIIAFSERLISGEPVLSIEENYEVFNSAKNSLQIKYRNSEHYLQFTKFIKNYEITQNRNTNTNNITAPPTELVNFKTQTIDGQYFELKSLKGEWILLNFWASWCINCSNNNQLIQKISKEKPEINIVQISIDKKENILKDSLNNYNFNHVLINDTKTWNSELINLYNIQYLPTNILINPQGKIILYSTDSQELFNLIK